AERAQLDDANGCVELPERVPFLAVSEDDVRLEAGEPLAEAGGTEVADRGPGRQVDAQPPRAHAGGGLRRLGDRAPAEGVAGSAELPCWRRRGGSYGAAAAGEARSASARSWTRRAVASSSRTRSAPRAAVLSEPAAARRSASPPA